MNTDPSCIFCKIVAGEAPAAIVAEDEVTLAFMDINPLTPGHLLVIPREHHESIATIRGSVLSHMVLIGQWLAAALRASPEIRTEGINLYLADGSAAGQEVPHSHLHLVPRWPGDGFRIRAERTWSPGPGDLEEMAAQIRDAATD
ncbi:MAG: HIT family protein [Acidimicrobiia bacterium]|nr:HIT family protein [Acidimicrobiia bacterium]